LYLTKAFCDALESIISEGEADAEVIEFFDAKEQKRWEAWDGRRRARWLVGQMCSCTDIIPSSDRQSINDLRDDGDREIFTYAQAARFLLRLMQQPATPAGI